MLNLSPLFFTTSNGESCMHGELELTPEQRAQTAWKRLVSGEDAKSIRNDLNATG